MAKRYAALGKIHSHLPAGRLTNKALEKAYPAWNTQAIYEKTGIRTRAVAGPEETASDLGVAAARGLFAAGKADAREIDFLLFCTQSPDYVLPTGNISLVRNSAGRLGQKRSSLIVTRADALPLRKIRRMRSLSCSVAKHPTSTGRIFLSPGGRFESWSKTKNKKDKKAMRL